MIVVFFFQAETGYRVKSGCLGSGLLFFPGWLAWVAISIWFLYRIVLGMVRLNGQRPVMD